MMTADLVKCRKCGYKKALKHWSSGGEVEWVACPSCESFFDHGELVEEKDANFWHHVRQDTGFSRSGGR
jgi:hypothetical protein